MVYKIDGATIAWAQRRSDQLTDSENDIGCAIDRMNKAITCMLDGANEMDDQPESDMVRAFAKNLQALTYQLEARFKSWKRDKKEIDRGIRVYRGGEKDGARAGRAVHQGR